jgi:hypothetical protein
MLQASAGNLIHADVEAIVNTVNTAGVMGKGLALQFKQAYPAMFRTNEAACKGARRAVGPGPYHFLQEYSAGADDPKKALELKEEAVEAALAALGADPALKAHVDEVSALIEGFEDPYGLELLSSVYWVMRHDHAAAESADAAVAAVQAWNPRKKQTLKAEHLRSAWDRLRQHQMLFNLQPDLQPA